VHDPECDALTRWGFARTGPHRRHFLAAGLADLAGQLAARGSRLVELHGRAQDVLPALARSIDATRIVCETISAPEEEAAVAALRAAGLVVDTVWQSSLLEPAALPFDTRDLPDVFTAFRQSVERAKLVPLAPQPVPHGLQPGVPPESIGSAAFAPANPAVGYIKPVLPALVPDPRSSFPYQSAPFAAGETVALKHLSRYFESNLVTHYKATRNGLAGTDYSSKLSPWLASGAISARSVYAALKQFEARHGANDGTYWLWFELLWRDYFRLLHLQHGRKLYGERGLAPQHLPLPQTTHKTGAFTRWRKGETGEPLVDAGMRELVATGYLSNRLRQVVASYLIHDLACDWRAGAAWFESQLVDYDVYSNQGNWLYIAGRGTDPRGGRRFNPQKQARDYDPDGTYRELWK
jgi:deoxyribodipyrimidine photo-lyase